jgi:voltage-gated potassium channel
MTVITVTTVGFGELKPFSPEEKIFTILLILTSINVF